MITEREDVNNKQERKKEYEPPAVVFDASIEDLAREMGPAQACNSFNPIVPNAFPPFP